MNKIVTISREFGSGGRELGKRLADELNFRYYDREIINEIAKETGMSEEYIENINEKGISPYPFQFAKSFATYSGVQSNQTEILVAQAKVIKKIAEKGDCIIIGRGANAILKDYNTMNIFVYADMESKINRCRQKAKEDEKMTDKEIKKKIIAIDEERKNFHKVISTLEWGEKSNYHLCINTTNIDIKAIVPSLAVYIKDWFGGK